MNFIIEYIFFCYENNLFTGTDLHAELFTGIDIGKYPGKYTTDILGTKAMLNITFSSIAKEGKNVPSIYPAFNVPILIRNDSLTSEESKAKNCFKYLICRMSFEHFS